jgi:hypothetical protein
MIRWIGGVLLVAILVLGFVAWRRAIAPAAPDPLNAGTPTSEPSSASTEAPPATAPAPAAPDHPAPAPDDVAAASGIMWTVPAGWRTGAPRAMRLATYKIGGDDPRLSAECAVFYFGQGLGGGVDENIDRWAGQFSGTPNSARTVLTEHGMKVTRVEIAGTFLAPGVDMQSQAQLNGWKLLGAIVEGPKGNVFFKLTGPADMLDRTADDFDGLLASLAKH